MTADVKVTKRAELDFACNRYYYEAVRKAGGDPVVIAPQADPAAVAAERERYDGLVFIGGDDLSGPFVPSHARSVLMHPFRQPWDLALLEAALAWPETPLLCICLGCQELNVVCGGTLIPHLPDLGGSVEHRRFGVPDQWHPATAVPGSRLACIVGTDEIRVNSSHHQAVDRLGEGLRVTARAPDGTVEAVELTVDDGRFLLAVQWHPERIVDHPPHLAIFQAFIAACQPK
jgi:putative glutamine amidotransferase